MSAAEDLRLSEARLRRALLRWVSPAVTRQILDELRERPRDELEQRVTPEERERIRRKLRRAGKLR